MVLLVSVYDIPVAFRGIWLIMVMEVRLKLYESWEPLEKEQGVLCMCVTYISLS